jgi:multidrug efflux system membrane fusion protein
MPIRGTYITAIIIAALIGVWLFSGQVGNDGVDQHPTLAQINEQRSAELQDLAPTRVRARVVHATPQVREVVLRGKTENKRTVEVKSEVAGRVIDRPVDRGAVVAAGDLLCRLSLDDRMAALGEARAALEQATIEYEGSLRLKERGFQSETAIAQAKARLAAAEAELTRRRLDLERTYVRAPFSGIVENVQLEVGDYVGPGSSCATIVDLDPMLLVGRVPEKDVQRLSKDQPVRGILSDGREVEGPITFIGQQSDAATRTYAVEVEVPNPEYALRSGITTEIHIPVDRVMAQKVSPALFALDDEGRIGIRTVDAQNRVVYYPVEIVRTDVDGVWVSGLPDSATIITVGQELVVAGEEVDVSYEPATELPARATPTRDDPDAGQSSSIGSAETPAPGQSAAATTIAIAVTP